MKNTALLTALGIAAGVFAAPALAAGTLVKFDGGIGVHPVAGVAGTLTAVPAGNQFSDVLRNDVRGVPPGGRPWVIRELRAEIKDDGHIRVDGRGLLLSGGNGTGTTGNQSVFATLICEPAAPFVEHNTNRAGVALEPNGDFRIDDELSQVPADCANPLLLIRNLGGAWFAAGIPRR